MQRAARKDNAFERSVPSLLDAEGLCYRIHRPLPRLKRTTCDLAFPGLMIAVFLEGASGTAATYIRRRSRRIWIFGEDRTQPDALCAHDGAPHRTRLDGIEFLGA